MSREPDRAVHTAPPRKHRFRPFLSLLLRRRYPAGALAPCHFLPLRPDPHHPGRVFCAVRGERYRAA